MSLPASSSHWPCLEVDAAGIPRLRLAVQPQARRTQVDGLHDDALRIRLAAPAIEGRANEALVAWLAAQLSLRQRDVLIEKGGKSRRKRVRLACEPQRVSAWLETVLPAAGA